MRNIIVTGASSGVGRAIVGSQLARHHRVFATGRSEKRLSTLADRAAAAGHQERLAVAVADLSSDSDLAEVVEGCRQHLGVPDTLVHTAFGHIGEDQGKSLLDVTPDEIREFVNDSITATFLSVQAFLPLLRNSGFPRIVFVIADWGIPQHNVILSGETADGQIGSEAFAAGKYAVSGFANALERQSRIAVSSLYPGVIASWAGEDESGEPMFLEIDSTPEEISAAGYSIPENAIPLTDVTDAVELMLSARSTIKTVVMKPARYDYTGV